MKTEQVNPTGQASPTGRAADATGKDTTTMALLYAEVKKLTKHFKLDRNSNNSSGEPDTPERIGEEDSKALREILERVNAMAKTIDRKGFTDEQITILRRMEGIVNKALCDFHNAEYSELKTTIENIGQAVDGLQDEKRDSTVTHHHRLSIEVKSSKVLLSLIGLSVALVGSAVLHVVQYLNADKFRDNDLKYRFIQMRKGATSDEVMQLREVFEFHRNPEIIKTIRRRVEEYEQLVKQEAENAAKARFNTAEAERLKRQAETVKGGTAKDGTVKGGAAKVKK